MNVEEQLAHMTDLAAAWQQDWSELRDEHEALKEDFRRLQAQAWEDVMRVIEMERKVQVLDSENRALEREVEHLRRRR